MADTNPIYKDFQSRISKSKRVRADKLASWRENIAYRLGTPFSDTDAYNSFTTSTLTDRVNIPIDWSMTKSKQAALFSQVPTVILEPKHPSFSSAVPVFQKHLNDTLTKEKVGVAMDECLPDCINAAGVAAIMVGYNETTEQVDVPSIDITGIPPEMVISLIQNGQISLERVNRTVDQKFPINRISPSDLLWPAGFTGSDFDDAPWMGRSGRMTWTEGKRTFGLSDVDKELVVSGDTKSNDRLNNDPDQYDTDADVICFDEIFYKRHLYHDDERYFDAIHHLVFVGGKDEPVINEPWKGQQFDNESRSYIGACRFPIRVLTLTYVTDEAIPPSDSQIIRSQVNELIKSRSQMVQQRDHSIPIRWFDVNRIDPATQDQLMSGTWQGMIPMQGNGANSIGEVARASHPPETFRFDAIAKQDIQEATGVGANQAGSFASGERTKAEAQIVDRSYQTEIGYQRARVSTFFVGIAEVLAGLLALFGDFDVPQVGQDGLQRLESWDRHTINQKFVYTIRPDATVLLDAGQRLQRATSFYNMAAPSGYAAVEPLLTEMASLSGFDPAMVIRAPQPKGPAEPNVSFRFSGAEDLKDPIAVAMLMKAGLGPTPEELAAALRLMREAGTVATTTLASAGGDEMTTTEHRPSPMPMSGAQATIPGAVPAALQVPQPQVGPQTEPVGATPKWATAPRVDKRSDEGAY